MGHGLRGVVGSYSGDWEIQCYGTWMLS